MIRKKKICSDTSGISIQTFWVFKKTRVKALASLVILAMITGTVKMQFRIAVLGCPKITPSLKCFAPDADSGAKFQVLMEYDQKNEIDQGLGVPNLI